MRIFNFFDQLNHVQHFLCRLDFGQSQGIRLNGHNFLKVIVSERGSQVIHSHDNFCAIKVDSGNGML